MEIFKNIFGWIINFLEDILNFVVQMLPDSPFQMLDNSPIKPYLGYFNWVFPIAEILAIMETWLIAISIFYTIQTLLRWVKTIE